MSSFLSRQTPASPPTADSIKAYADRWFKQTSSANLFLCAFGTILLGLIYWMTLAPTVFTLDSAEFATAAYALGIVHSPGYVVYLLIAHGMTYLPLGDVAFRVNLLSAIFSLLAFVVFFYLLQPRVGSRIAWLAGMILGLNFYVWSLSVVAEVYTMQMFLFLLLLYLGLRWSETGAESLFYPLAFIAGLTVANNPVTILWSPGLLYLIWYRRQSLSLKRFLIAILCGVAGLMPLLYLPLRASGNILFTNIGTYTPDGEFIPVSLASWTGFRWYMTGQEFDSLMFGYSPLEALQETGSALNRLIASSLGIGFPLAIWGMSRLWQRDRQLFIVVTAAILPYTFFFVNYAAVDKETMFLPVHTTWTIFIAFGLDGLVSYFQQQEASNRWGRHLSYVAFIIPVLLLLVNWTYVDLSNTTGFADLGRIQLSEAEPNSIYISRWGEAAVLDYLQIVEGKRQDVTVINSVFISTPASVELIQTALANGQAVYTTFLDENLTRYFVFQENGGGYQVVSP